jgi:aminoglycoside phosphotransferase (APT) family kinase protein
MSRQRPTWPEIPDALRDLIEARVGEVTAWTSHDGGYSPGPALTLTTATDRVFVKAADVTEHPLSADLHRREARTAALLPSTVPAPALRWSVDSDETSDWVVLGFDAVDGRSPRVPWSSDDVRAVAVVVETIAQIPAPAGLPEFSDSMTFDGWRTLAGSDATGIERYDPWALANLARLAAIEPTWTEAVAGDVLVHQDLRGDNVLLTGRGAVVVDWPYASRGAAFCDLVGWLPSLKLEGGPDPEEMVASTRVGREADPEALTTLVVALAGYFVSASLQPPPPGIPHVRAFQRAQGEVCLDWLKLRLG